MADYGTRLGMVGWRKTGGFLGVNLLIQAAEEHYKDGIIMAEMNGIDRLVAARKELEDALIVMAHLETRSSAMMKDHAAFLVAMDKRHELKKAEFDDKLKALIDMESSRG